MVLAFEDLFSLIVAFLNSYVRISQVPSKPKVSGGRPTCCTSELSICVVVVTKVIFQFCGTFLCLECAFTFVTVHVENTSVGLRLPPLGATLRACGTSYVNVLHHTTMSIPYKGQWIHRGKRGSHIVHVVDAIFGKATSVTPVSGTRSDALHHAQAHSVDMPVCRLLVHGQISRQKDAKLWQKMAVLGMGHSESPR